MESPKVIKSPVRKKRAVGLTDAAWNGDTESMFKLLQADDQKRGSSMSDEWWNAFEVALIRNEDDITQMLLSSCADVNTTKESSNHAFDKGDTLLIKVARAGAVQFAQSLLIRGVNANAVNKFGNTALHIAAALENPRLTEVLLPYAVASLNLHGYQGKTPLHCACRNNSSAVMALVSVGADVNAKTPEGDTPLHIAAAYCSPEIVKYLLMHNANLAALNASDKDALTMAVSHRRVDNARVLMSADDPVNPINKGGGGGGGRTALWSAIEGGCTEVVSLLINAGAAIDAELDSDDGNKLLARACKNEALGSVLIKHCSAATIDRCSPDEHRTVLHIACLHGHAKIVAEVLAKSTASMDVKDVYGVTPLYYAVDRASESAVEMLITAGASISACDVNKPALVQRACEIANASILMALLRCPNVDVNLTGKSSGTALWTACNRGDIRMVYALINSGCDVNQIAMSSVSTVTSAPLHVAAVRGNAAVVSALLRAGATPDAKDSDGNTALDIAVKSANSALIIRALLMHHADFSANASGDKAPLVRAAKSGYTDVVKELLTAAYDKGVRISALESAIRGLHPETASAIVTAGTDPTTRVGDGRTMLHVLCGSQWINSDLPRMLTIAGALIKCGIDINSRDSYQMTPIFMAAELSNLTLIKFLIASGADVNAITSEGTSLVSFVVNAHLGYDVIKLLLYSGADPTVPNTDGHDAYHYADADIAYFMRNLMLQIANHTTGLDHN